LWILKKKWLRDELILRSCPVLAIAYESFPAKVFSDSIPCGIGPG
jgi:hypothetical protein